MKYNEKKIKGKKKMVKLKYRSKIYVFKNKSKLLHNRVGGYKKINKVAPDPHVVYNKK